MNQHGADKSGSVLMLGPPSGRALVDLIINVKGDERNSCKKLLRATFEALDGEERRLGNIWTNVLLVRGTSACEDIGVFSETSKVF